MYSACSLIWKTADSSVSGNGILYDMMWEGFISYYILFLSNWPFCIRKKNFFLSKYSVKFEKFAHFDFKKVFHNFSNNMLFIAYTENTATYSHRMEPKHLSPPCHLLSNHRPLSSHAAAAGQQQMASTAAQTAGSLSHTPKHSGLFHSWN
jgi:hypothetical protein